MTGEDAEKAVYAKEAALAFSRRPVRRRMEAIVLAGSQ